MASSLSIPVLTLPLGRAFFLRALSAPLPGMDGMCSFSHPATLASLLSGLSSFGPGLVREAGRRLSHLFARPWDPREGRGSSWLVWVLALGLCWLSDDWQPALGGVGLGAPGVLHVQGRGCSFQILMQRVRSFPWFNPIWMKLPPRLLLLDLTCSSNLFEGVCLLVTL